MHHKFKQYPNLLRKHRKNAGLRQREVARLLGLKTAERLSRWENGMHKPMPKTVFLLAQIYQVSPQELFNNLWNPVSSSTDEAPLGKRNPVEESASLPSR